MSSESITESSVVVSSDGRLIGDWAFLAALLVITALIHFSFDELAAWMYRTRRRRAHLHVRALLQMKNKSETANDLIKYLGSPSSAKAAEAAELIAEIGLTEALPHLHARLQDPIQDYQVWETCAHAMSMLEDKLKFHLSQ